MKKTRIILLDYNVTHYNVLSNRLNDQWGQLFPKMSNFSIHHAIKCWLISATRMVKKRVRGLIFDYILHDKSSDIYMIACHGFLVRFLVDRCVFYLRYRWRPWALRLLSLPVISNTSHNSHPISIIIRTIAMFNLCRMSLYALLLKMNHFLFTS